jgi:GH18 family chitinase
LQEYRNQWRQFEQNGRKFELTVAMPSNKQAYLEGQNLQNFKNAVDFIMVMAYEYQFGSKVTRHGANLFANPNEPAENHRFTVDAGVKSYLANGAGFDKAQIVVGVPCYARGFKNVKATSPEGIYAPYEGEPSELMEFRNMSSLASRGFKEFYDNQAKSAWAYSEREQVLRPHITLG